MLSKKFFRMKTFYSYTHLALVSFVISIPIYTYTDVPGNYESDYNYFCDYSHTKEEKVCYFWSPNVNSKSPAEYLDFLDDMMEMAQHVDTVTLSWETPPFEDTTFTRWSDTWGVCVYFTSNGYHPNCDWGPDPVTNMDDALEWDDATSGGVDIYTWRIVEIDDLWGTLHGLVPGDGSDYGRKIALIEENEPLKIYLHEWGHVPNSQGASLITTSYWWPIFGSFHYGRWMNGYESARSWYWLNFMHFTPSNGPDGDYEWKYYKFPWYNNQYWYNSYRWDSN